MIRLRDIAVAIAALAILSPVLILLGIFVAATMGRPVLFKQLRPGLHGKPFRLIKFRTMLDAVDRNRRPLEDGLRLTRAGRFLRATSLDELPELWNILCGEMSLVGPRPLLTDYLPLYSAEQARRHEVRPGLTGWAQVNGRNALTWEEKFRLDTWYVDHRSFLLDLRILALTFVRVLQRDGISGEQSATMSRFEGN